VITSNNIIILILCIPVNKYAKTKYYSTSSSTTIPTDQLTRHHQVKSPQTDQVKHKISSDKLLAVLHLVVRSGTYRGRHIPIESCCRLHIQPGRGTGGWGACRSHGLASGHGARDADGCNDMQGHL